MNIPPPPRYLCLDQARQTLAEMGIEFSERQMKRAADPDARGQRKLPFFLDPVDGRLKIEKGALTAVYPATTGRREEEYEKRGLTIQYISDSISLYLLLPVDGRY